jgi:hypothetical protein
MEGCESLLHDWVTVGEIVAEGLAGSRLVLLISFGDG